MRVFKTKGFAAAAKKADIPDTELCEAMQEVAKGQGVDLGANRENGNFRTLSALSVRLRS